MSIVFTVYDYNFYFRYNLVTIRVPLHDIAFSFLLPFVSSVSANVSI